MAIRKITNENSVKLLPQSVRSQETERDSKPNTIKKDSLTKNI